MSKIEEIYTKHPYYGSRRIVVELTKYGLVVNLYDVLGLKEYPSSFYNQYDNPTSAVRKRGKYINPRSKKESIEYCGQVCKVCKNGKNKYFTTQTTGTEDGCNPSSAPCPSDSISVAMWHTHGGFVDKENNETGEKIPDGKDDYDSENFSDITDDDGRKRGDIPYSESKKQDIYLITPNSQFKQYVPSSKGGTVINRGNL
ncbi:MAG: hypothetical protein A2020_03470 [Lentisphaerae bacterium GWF2_45_14]|nr:MAG: hypothetical protein A2020_03470 [Lentisphaerae bacterium GWF2_45_14]